MQGEKKSGKSVYIAAALLFVAGLGWLLYSGLSGGSVYFLNVSEALAMPKAELGQARLFGTVAAEDLSSKSDRLGVVFRLVDSEDPSKTMMVDYAGAVPDTFKPGVEVIVEGRMNGSGAFNAATLMTKCPSKYEKENREAS